MRHWPPYHIWIFEQVRDWLLEDDLPEDEANQHAHHMVSVIPDVFKIAVRPGSVINTIHQEYIGTGILTVLEKGVEHQVDGLWQYVDTTQGKKLFGLANVPDTSTGHVLVIRADTEGPPEPTPADYPPGATHL